MEKAFVLICEPPLPIEGISGLCYAGIDRQPWSCVDDLRYSKALPDRLGALRTRSLQEYIGNLSFGSLASYQEVLEMAAVCTSTAGMEIVEVESIGLLEDSRAAVPNLSTLIGLDVFVDGYGSVIRLGMVKKPAGFFPVLDTLNANGLLKSIDAAHRYVHHYLSIMKSDDLEIIESTLPIWIYGIRSHMNC